jgi:hypothetical protein
MAKAMVVLNKVIVTMLDYLSQYSLVSAERLAFYQQVFKQMDVGQKGMVLGFERDFALSRSAIRFHAFPPFEGSSIRVI